jgi:organic hydroperoxide reductase OsmC/OhrA
MIQAAKELHKKANELCFIANSVNFPVKHDALIKTK